MIAEATTMDTIKQALTAYGGWISAGVTLLIGVIAVSLWARGRRAGGRNGGTGAFDGPSGVADYDAALATEDFQEAALIARRMRDNRRYAEAVERSGDLERAVQAWHDAGEPLKSAVMLARAGHLAKAGRLFFDLGALREALDCFVRADDVEGAARVVDKQGDHVRANLLRGEALQRKGEYAEAARRFIDGLDPLKAAQALELAGDLPGAAAQYRRAGRAEEAARLISTLDPKQGAQLFEEAGRFDEAASAWRGLGDLVAYERALHRAGRSFEAGRSAFERKDAVVALEYLGAVDPLHGNYREAQLLRGQLFERRGDLDAAGDSYYAFLDGRAPSERTKPLFLRLAQIKEGCGQSQTALKVLARLITGGFGTPDVTAHAARLEQAIAKTPPTEVYSSENELLVRKASPGRRRAASADGGQADGSRTQLRPVEAAKGGPSLASTLAQGGTSPDVDPPAVQVLSRRYKFLGKLGQGGNGVVYRAVDRALGRNAVVKFLHQALLPTDVARKYFEREAKTAASLSHPNIVTIYDVGEEGETLYFSMELVEGRTLADLIVDAGGRLTHKQILPIITQLCSALEYAHGRQVIHRDIKPGNIMVSEAGHVKLLDFGLAKALDENPDKSVFLCGTPFYMSPEQIRRDFMDQRTDIYSLGCLLYVMYTGDVPFPEGNVFFHQQNTPAPSADTLVDGLPRGVSQVLLKCVAKERGERYQRAGEVSAALNAIG